MNRWSKPWGEKHTIQTSTVALTHFTPDFIWWFGTHRADEWGEVAPAQFVKSPGSMSCNIFNRITDLISSCMEVWWQQWESRGPQWLPFLTMPCRTLSFLFHVSAHDQFLPKCQHITEGSMTYQSPSQQPHSGWQNQTWDMTHWQHSNQPAGTGTLLPVHHTTLSVVW